MTYNKDCPESQVRVKFQVFEVESQDKSVNIGTFKMQSTSPLYHKTKPTFREVCVMAFNPIIPDPKTNGQKILNF